MDKSSSRHAQRQLGNRRRFFTRAGAAAGALALSVGALRPAFADGEMGDVPDGAVDPTAGQPALDPGQPAATAALPALDFAYGMQAHYYFQDVPAVLGLIGDAGFGWTKQQVRWADVEPVPGDVDWEPLDAIADAAAAGGVRVLFSVVTAPAWSRSDGAADGPPDDPATFADFLSRLAERFAGRVQAYEVWNEQNFSREWGGGRVSPGEYVELLKAAYPAIKAADPGALVLSGALTPTGFNDPTVAMDDVLYLQRCYAYQDGVFTTVCDAIGAHAGGYNNPPDDTPQQQSVPGTTFKGHASFYFRRIEQLREVMVLAGESAKKLWVTEFGWSTANAAPGYEYGRDNTEQDQANYLARALEIGRTYGWVAGMFVWNLNFQQASAPDDEKFPFGIIRPDGSPRPAYVALQQMAKPA